MKATILNGNDLTLDLFTDIVFNKRPIELDPTSMQTAANARALLFKMADEGYPVYGLNRGVGWNKDKFVFTEFFDRYNRNLLFSHALGMGPDNANEAEVRAMLLVRTNTALCGATGLNPDILIMFKEFLNKDILPIVPRRGSIGNADLATLAHLGLAVIGEGNVTYKGKVISAAAALEKEGLTPLILGPKDGLSIVSSNAHGASVAAFLTLETDRMLKLSNILYCLGLEGLNGVIEPLDEEANKRRGFSGQIKMAAQCREYLKESYLHHPHEGRALQDALSYRSSFAINGAIYQANEHLKKLLEIQLNHTDDNPCIMSDLNKISVSTNFEPMVWAVAIEGLNIALSHLSKSICYRCIKLGDPYFTHLNRFLSPKEGEILAFATMQKAYTSIDTENRSLANPSSMDYFSLAGNIEDHANSCVFIADKGLKMLDNMKYMMAMEAIECAQAIDLRRQQEEVKLGIGTDAAYMEIRKVIDYYDKDRCISDDIAKGYELFSSNLLLEAVEAAIKG